ncbi:MAG: 4Fe-4S dicluster domain-containing protein [Elusimicrobiota bacterium]
MTEDERRQYEEQDKIDVVQRRDFLKILGAGFAALASGCDLRPPKDKILPYSEQAEGTVPGLARWYASTCAGCAAACGVLVKSRDGRPIKMEGNPDHPLSRGGLCARGQATVLDLYDSERLKHPLAGIAQTSWAALDTTVEAGLANARRRGLKIRVLSQTTSSPSLDAAAAAFCARHGAERVIYDSTSAAAIIEAHRLTHGRAVLPHYRFETARAIVSFDADFLGTWLSPVEFTKSWAAKRKPDDGFEGMSWHAQFEPRLSVTGANADLRMPVRPSEELATALTLGRLLASRLNWGGDLPKAGRTSVSAEVLRQTADTLAAARGAALAVSGSSDVAVQLAMNWINEMLGAYGRTADLARPSFQRRGETGAMERLIAEMEGGEVGVLLVVEANPAYDHPKAARFSAALKDVGLVVALSQRRDETASRAGAVAATPHALESWGDAEPVAGVYSLIQPLIEPLFDSRPALESLLAWAGRPAKAHDFVRELWRAKIHPRHQAGHSFDAFWDEALQRGAVTVESEKAAPGAFRGGSLSGLKPARAAAPKNGFEMSVFAGSALFDGRQANNPWLQELPDPVTKVSWGNVALFSPDDAKKLGVEDGRMVRLSVGGRSIDLPACVQPGQASGVVAAALGYGRTAAGPIASNEPMRKMLPIEQDPLGGADVYPFGDGAAVTVTLLAGIAPLAKTQIFDSQTVPFTGETRPIVLETTLQDYYKLPPPEPLKDDPDAGLWPKHDYPGHKWGMALNLTACTGCAGCVVACQVENNIPVVGKAEVRKGREMHWIRIDRYYTGEDEKGNPDVAFQPMLCQHCDDAPCETVCPVLATVHSTEGLNMQVYNRCVGTRYCANNCPYKVRRFNWFDYSHENLLQSLVLNPDVTVRSRGVMEKCSFCVQRIYTAKFTADSEGRAVKDGDVIPACAQSCPAEAIVFGDLNDPNSKVTRVARENHSYRVLEELGTGPSVFYGIKVRNTRVRKA